MAVRRLKRTRGFFEVLGRRIRYFYLRLILLPDTPHVVALGLAIGIFVGLTPTVPFQTIIALPLAWLFRGSKIASVMGVWITNPLTIPAFYAAFYFVGRALTPFGHRAVLPPLWDIHDLLRMGSDVLLATFCGGLIMGVVLAPIAYLLVFYNIGKLQAWERRKLRQKFDLHPANPK